MLFVMEVIVMRVGVSGGFVFYIYILVGVI